MEPLLTNFNYPLQYIRKSIQRKHKLSLQTNNFIKKTTITTTITVATAATPYIITTNRNHVTLCVIRKDVIYRNILIKNQKSLRLNLKISLRTAFRSK